MPGPRKKATDKDRILLPESGISDDDSDDGVLPVSDEPVCTNGKKDVGQLRLLGMRDTKRL
jgi:hypothetical protein